MYRNVIGEKVSRARFKEMLAAMENRRELIAAGLMNRRDLFKMGLLTSAGYLLAKRGLSARWGSLIPEMQAASPTVKPFVQPLPIMPIKQPVSSLNPAPIPPPVSAQNPTNPNSNVAPFDFSDAFYTENGINVGQLNGPGGRVGIGSNSGGFGFQNQPGQVNWKTDPSNPDFSPEVDKRR